MKKQFHSPQIFCLLAEPFKTDIVISVNSTKQQLATWLKKNANPDKVKGFDINKIDHWTDPLNEGLLTEIAGGYIILIKADKTQFRKFVGTLVHEITHAAHYILRTRRIPLTEDTEEIYTYLIESLTVQALFMCYK